MSWPESYKVCIVGRSGDGDRARAAHVGVAQLVGQLLQLVSLEPAHMESNSQHTSQTTTYLNRYGDTGDWWIYSNLRNFTLAGIGSSPAGGKLGNFSTDFDLKDPT